MAGTIVKTLTTSIGVDALKPQIRDWINEGRKEFDPIYTQYMKDPSTTEAFVEDYELGGFPALPRRDEGDILNFVAMGLGGKTRYEPDPYQGAFVITERMRRFNKIGLVEKFTKRLARAGRVTVEQVAAQVINLCFSTAFVGNDNQPLASASHLLANGALTSNTATAVTLSQAALEDAGTIFLSTLGPDGYPINVAPKFLIVGPALAFRAQRIVDTMNYFSPDANGRPNAAATASPNPMNKYNIQVVVNQYIRSTTLWGLLAAKNDQELQVLWGLKPSDKMFQDDWTDDFVFSHFLEIVSGFSTFIGTYFNAGA